MRRLRTCCFVLLAFCSQLHLGGASVIAFRNGTEHGEPRHGYLCWQTTVKAGGFRARRTGVWPNVINRDHEILVIKSIPFAKWRVDFLVVSKIRGKPSIFFTGRAKHGLITAQEGRADKTGVATVKFSAKAFGDAMVKITVFGSGPSEVWTRKITSYTLLPKLVSASAVVPALGAGVIAQRVIMTPGILAVTQPVRLTIPGYHISGLVSGKPGFYSNTFLKLRYKLVFGFKMSKFNGDISTELLRGLPHAFKLRAREYYPSFSAKVAAKPAGGGNDAASFNWSTSHATTLNVAGAVPKWKPATHQLSTGAGFFGLGNAGPLKFKPFMANVIKMQTLFGPHINKAVLEQYDLGTLEGIGFGSRQRYTVDMRIDANTLGRTGLTDFKITSQYFSMDILLVCPVIE